MSDYHILKQKLDKLEANFVFHYPTPVGNNYASVAYNECIKRDRSPSDSIVPNLLADNPTEHAKVLTGEVYEDSITLTFTVGMSNAQKLALAESKWTELKANFLAQVPIRYKFYGHAGNAP
jgi:hypothetical protein